MQRIYFDSRGLGDWQSHLADPKKHWKQKCSAFELAVSWELAARTSDSQGLPTEVRNVLCAEPTFGGAELLFAVPEHVVALKGSGFGSHTDLWALLRTSQGLASMAVEGKAGETFGETIGDWLIAGAGKNSVANRSARLEWLCKTLGIPCDKNALSGLRYQLFHRTVSAVLEAKRCHAQHAVLLVQDFSGKGRISSDFKDFEVFGSHLGASVAFNSLAEWNQKGGIRLWLGWVECKVALDSEIMQVVV